LFIGVPLAFSAPLSVWFVDHQIENGLRQSKAWPRAIALTTAGDQAFRECVGRSYAGDGSSPFFFFS